MKPARANEIRAHVDEQVSLLASGFGPGWSPDEVFLALSVYQAAIARVLPAVVAARSRGEWT